MNIRSTAIQAFLKANRNRLFAVMTPNTYAIVYGPFFDATDNTNRINTLPTMTTSAYHKNQHLYWLTGIDEPETTRPISAAIFIKNTDESTEFLLFTGNSDMDYMSKHNYGANRTYPSLNAQQDNEFSNCLLTLADKTRILDTEISFQISKLRMIKSDFEIAQIRTATLHTSIAIIRAMSHTTSEKNEQSVKTFIDQALNEMGYPNNLSFSTSVSGGNHIGCALGETKEALKENQMIFINAGARNGMTTDITGQFPIGGTMDPLQQNVYEVLLSIYEKIVNEAARADITAVELEKLGRQHLTEGLIQLGLLAAPADDEAHREYFNDLIFRWIGYNLFEPYSYVDEKNQPIKLNKNMVFTLAVSISVPNNSHSVYRGISMCIRDAYVRNTNGIENLGKVPRSLAAIKQCITRPASPSTLRLMSSNTDNSHDRDNNSNNNSNWRNPTYS